MTLSCYSPCESQDPSQFHSEFHLHDLALAIAELLCIFNLEKNFIVIAYEVKQFAKIIEGLGQAFSLKRSMFSLYRAQSCGQMMLRSASLVRKHAKCHGEHMVFFNLEDNFVTECISALCKCFLLTKKYITKCNLKNLARKLLFAIHLFVKTKYVFSVIILIIVL